MRSHRKPNTTTDSSTTTLLQRILGCSRVYTALLVQLDGHSRSADCRPLMFALHSSKRRRAAGSTDLICRSAVRSKVRPKKPQTSKSTKFALRPQGAILTKHKLKARHIIGYALLALATASATGSSNESTKLASPLNGID